MTPVRAALLTLLALLLIAGLWSRRAVHAWNEDSEAHVISTMRYHVQQGHAPPGGLLVVAPADTVYPSSSGVQGYFAGLVARRFVADYAALQPRPVDYPDAWHKSADGFGTAVVMLKSASLGLTAMVLAAFALFIAVEWSAIFALLFAMLVGTSYTLAWWSTNLYWATPTLFLPFVAAWFLARGMRRGEWSAWRIVMVVGGATLLKALCGYEWLSCIVAAASVPFVYYAVLDARPLRETAVRIATVAAAGVAGTAAALAVHLSKLSAARGSLSAALGAFGGRAGHWVGAAAAEADYPRSGMIGAPFMNLELAAFGPLRLKLWLFLLLVVVSAAALLWRARLAGNAATAWRAAGVALLYSLACSLSWPVLASAHFAAHLHLGLIVFFLPTALVLFALPAMLAPRAA